MQRWKYLALVSLEFTLDRCRENCARKTALAGYKILTTTCSADCYTKFGGLRYQWRMYRQIVATGQWEEYTDLEELSATGTHFLNYTRKSIQQNQCKRMHKMNIIFLSKAQTVRLCT